MMTTILPKPTHKRGDVVLVLFPNSDLRTAKIRPVVIIQATNLDTGIAQHIVAMITSNLARANHPSRVVIHRATVAGQNAGLLSDSVVMTDNLATIASFAMTRIIGYLDMSAVEVALRYTFAL